MDVYEVEINGITHTMQLSADDAARYGDLAKKVGSGEKATRPANKSAAAANKS